MKFEEAEISGVGLLKLKERCDSRGSFTKLFSPNEACKMGLIDEVGQINHSVTKRKGTFRGLHFQRAPFAEQKLVYCLKGSITDILVDLRRGSSTFLKTIQIPLTSESSYMIVVPKGVAHGFQTLQEQVELIYVHSTEYAPEFEGGIRYSDPLINLILPLEIADISDRDKNHALLSPKFEGLTI